MDQKIRTLAETQLKTRRNLMTLQEQIQNQQQPFKSKCGTSLYSGHGKEETVRGSKLCAAKSTTSTKDNCTRESTKCKKGLWALQERLPKVEKQESGKSSWEWSFMSTTFSYLIDIVLTTLDHGYDVELADGKIIEVNTLIRGCTLNFLNHPFNIDLMPVELGSFDVIIGMDWLTKYHVVIVFLAHVTAKKAEDKLEEKRLEDVPIVSRLF
ncbi:putative reverse transcriptase domain-containing protein [Tanacetum coccineum]